MSLRSGRPVLKIFCKSKAEDSKVLLVRQPAEQCCGMGLHNLLQSWSPKPKHWQLIIRKKWTLEQSGQFFATHEPITTLSLGAQLIGHDLLLMRSNKEQECKVRNKRVRASLVFGKEMARGGRLDGWTDRVWPGPSSASESSRSCADPWSSGGYKSRAPKWIAARRARTSPAHYTL